ncbi:tetratricopeptide repeat protein [Saccharopolyspora taberi]|uniref:Tetratricopeptide repeat protein n=1 Tax=Saccharopolyspora taberi TaxID=60895 RepID=A0ABN3VIA1_9PSEU
MDRAPSFQEIIRGKQRGDFVGREHHRHAFRENFRMPATDRKFVFSVHGQAGIGKTYLLRQLRAIALEAEALVTATDENELDLVTTMVAITRQLEARGGRSRRFTQRYEQYQRRQDELLMDPEAPSAARELLTSATVRMTVGAMKAVPGLGLLAEAFTPEDIADRVEKARGFLSHKFNNHADVRLVLSPVEELTPLLVEDLRELARHRPLVLMFDTFERTSQVLEQWLLRIFGGHYGELPSNLTFVFVGQQPLDRNLWGEYSLVVEDWQLEPFTEAEARKLLERRGVRDDRVAEVVFGLSGGLPLLVAMLAERGPRDPDEIGDPSGSAVERFLKWEPDPQHRKDALLGALPRTLDEDVLAVLVGQDRAAEVLERLRTLPFVSDEHGRPQYHQVVREQMVRLQRTRSPQRFAERHQALAEHFGSVASKVDQPYSWTVDWVRPTSEQHYHLLCADPFGGRAEVLEGAAEAARRGIGLARRWAEVIAAAGRDTDVGDLRRWGARLGELVSDDSSLTRFASLIVNEGGLKGDRRVTALLARAICHIDDDEPDSALADLEAALEIRPDSVPCRSWRGTVHRMRGDFAASIADLTFALEAEPDRDFDLAERGVSRLSNGDLDGALADLSGALERDPENTWAISALCSVQRSRGEQQVALELIDRAIAQEPDDAFLHVKRGWIISEQGDAQGALACYDRAIELDPEFAEGWLWRGVEHKRIEAREKALSDLGRALELDPRQSYGYSQRAHIWRSAGESGKAMADLDEAIRLDPTDDWALCRRADLWQERCEWERARADLDEAIRLDPEFADYYYRRTLVHLMLDDPAPALADATRVCELEPEDPYHHFVLADAMFAAGDLDGALAQLENPICLEHDSAWHHHVRGLVRRARGDDADVEPCLRLALEAARRECADRPEEVWLQTNLVVIHLALGEYDEALGQAQRVFQQPVPLQARADFRRDLHQLRRVMPEHAERIDAILAWPGVSVS